jgi:hypothetical protein
VAEADLHRYRHRSDGARNQSGPAHVEHVVFGKDPSHLAAARARMMADPDYDQCKYEEAVESAKRIEAVYSVAWTQS